MRCVGILVLACTALARVDITGESSQTYREAMCIFQERTEQ